MSRRTFWSKLFGSGRVARPSRKRRAPRLWNSLQAHVPSRKLMVEGLEARLCLNGSWTAEAPMPTPRRSFGIAADPDTGLIYAVGGRSTSSPEATTENEVYNPLTNSWATKAPLPSPHADGGAAFVDGILYVIGGYTGSGFTASVEAYNPATDTWSSRSPAPEVSVSFGIAVVDDIIYLVGGNNTSTVLAHTYAYDPATDSWTAKNPYPGNVGSPAVGVIDGVIYVAAGQGISGTVATVEAYDPVADTWSAKADMPTPRQEAAGSVVGGRLYVMGGGFFGSSNSGPLTTVEAYDPASDTWTADTSMPTARLDPGAVTVNGVIYVMGGRDEPDHKFGANEAFTPTQPTVLDATGSTQTSINIAKNGDLVFTLSNVTGILAGDGTVYDLFNGAAFQLRIGGQNGALYSVSSAAVVLADGSIQISWRMTDELYNDLHALLGSATPSNKTPVDFFISGTSNDGNYTLSEDVLSRIFQQGNVKFS